MGVIMTTRPNVTGAPLMRGARRRADIPLNLPALCRTWIEGKIAATCDDHHHQAGRRFCLAC